MTILSRVGLAVTAVMLLVAGCESSKEAPKTDEPSYAELVIIYNAELESLDRLERKRKEMIAEYEAKHRPDTSSAIKSIADLVGAAGESNKGEGSNAAGAPQDDLDRAVAQAERANEVASKILDSLGQVSGGEEGGLEIVYSEEFQQELAEFDKEIEAQKQRVERARQKRDEAEQKR